MEPSIQVTIVGADNRNVLARTRKGYARKGAALVLNQETSKWIASRNSQVEMLYVRSGHNFSPDWMTRTTYGEIEKWAGNFGFPRVRLRPMWEEMMQGCRRLQLKEVEVPEIRTEQKAQGELICVAEWWRWILR